MPLKYPEYRVLNENWEYDDEMELNAQQIKEYQVGWNDAMADRPYKQGGSTIYGMGYLDAFSKGELQ